MFFYKLEGFKFNIRGKLRNPIFGNILIWFLRGFTVFDFGIEILVCLIKVLNLIWGASFSPEYSIPPNNKKYP